MKSTERASVLVLAFALAAACVPAEAQGQRRIPLAQIEAMFANMRAKAPWNVDGPLLWGYFFFDPSREKLERAAGELQAAGYHVAGISQVQGQQRFRLHVERVEIHTPVTLDARNQELYAMAERLGLASYDGMDVGSVQGPSK
jgi:hypothetical protein